jgi:hypothetical protein
MFDRKKFRNNIEEQLRNAPRDKCVAFATRSAMRVLPLLAARKGAAFYHWKTEDKNRYLLSVLRNYIRGIEYVLTKGHIDLAAANTDAHIVHAASAEASYNDVNCSTVYAANAAYMAYTACTEDPRAAYEYAHLLVPDFYNYATAAAYTAEASIDAHADVAIMQEIHLDLVALDKMLTERFLQQPLWIESTTKEWQQLNSRFKFAVLKLNASFDIWMDWYNDRLQGKPIDMPLLRQWNNIPEEIEKQGVSAINAYLKSLQPKTESPSAFELCLNCFRRLW